MPLDLILTLQEPGQVVRTELLGQFDDETQAHNLVDGLVHNLKPQLPQPLQFLADNVLSFTEWKARLGRSSSNQAME
jgi:hypothetical protein